MMVTVANGCDLDYAGHAGGRGLPGRGYYLAVMEAGEPPGTW